MSMSLKKKVRELTGDDATQASQITALQTAVGDSDSGLVKAVADIVAAIGDAETSGTILYRLAQLEKE